MQCGADRGHRQRGAADILLSMGTSWASSGISRPWRLLAIVFLIVAVGLAFKPNWVTFHGKRTFCGVGVILALPADPWPPGDPRRALGDKCESTNGLWLVSAIGSGLMAAVALGIESYQGRSRAPRRPD